VNFAGIGWTNVEALRRKGVDARLVVFQRERLHPEADVDLDLPPRFWRGLPKQLAALVRLLPRTDVFHFYFGITLVPKKLQFPVLRATGRKSVFHFIGSDIRGKTPGELAFRRRADAQVVGSFDAKRWVPEAEVIPPGIDLRGIDAVPPREDGPVRVVHAALNRRRKGTEHIVAACEQLGVELDVVENVHHAEARARYAAADVVVDQLNAGWYGLFAIEAMALGKPVLGYLHDEAVAHTEEAFGVEIPIVNVTKETLSDRLRPLVEAAAERRRLGAASRAYVERLHDVDRNAERWIDLYENL
jgi:glycosyltransferase involved in cell wall biosynthesis